MKKINNSRDLRQSVYVQKDNMEMLQEFLNKNPSLNLSNVINSALEVYLGAEIFDGDKIIREDKDYRLVILRVRVEVLKVLRIFRRKYKCRGVFEFINGHLLKALSVQHDEEFPRKDNIGAGLIKKWSDKVKMKLIRKGFKLSEGKE